MKNAVLNGVAGTLDTTLTADALSTDLQGVNSDNVYMIYNTADNSFLTQSDLNSNGTVKKDVYDGNSGDQFVAINATLTRDALVATPSTDGANDGARVVGAFAADGLNASPDSAAKALGQQYGQNNKHLFLNYSVTKSHRFGITENGSAAGYNFKQLYDAAIK